MRLSKVWIVAAKDLKIFKTRKSVLYSIVMLPLIAGVGFPVLIHFIISRGANINSPQTTNILNAFSFFFIIIAAILPTTIAAYSLGGEKVEKSLEPLLATPTTDSELLLGKSLAAFLPPIIAVYIGAILFMVLMDKVTFSALGHNFFPNWTIGVILLLVAPLTAIFSTEASVIISSRVNDVRSAQQFGALTSLPVAAIYMSIELGFLSFDVTMLLITAAVVLAIDVVLFFIATKLFQREEILTKWN
jgi:ABC-2 type transport system permease protein